MNTVKLPFYARLALTLLAVVLILFLMQEGKTIFIPLLFALLGSVLLFPITRGLERIGLWRGVAAMISVLLFVILLGLFFYFLTLQIADFSKDLPRLQTRFMQMLQHIQYWIQRKYHVSTRDQMAYVNKNAGDWITTAANSVGNTFLSVSEIIIWGIFVIIYTYFMLFHRKLLMKFILGLFLDKQHDQVHEVIIETRSLINSYVIGLLTEMIIVAVVNSATLAIIGIPYALFLGVLAAVLNIIPYLGIYSATALSMLITFANGSGSQALAVGIVFLIIHFIDANILLPRIVGKRVKMNPFITIVAVVVGNLLWGIPGMFLFIPLTAIIKIISERVDGLKPWAILIGEDVKEPNTGKKNTGRKKPSP